METIDLKEIRAKYAARKCETQMEFERLMSEMNVEQTHLNAPPLTVKGNWQSNVSF